MALVPVTPVPASSPTAAGGAAPAAGAASTAFPNGGVAASPMYNRATSLGGPSAYTPHGYNSGYYGTSASAYSPYSSYGGGGYGGAYGNYGAYGGGYGYGGYGSAYGAGAYGGYGGMGPMGAGGPYDGNPNKLLNGGQTLLHGVESSVQSFGRISHLLQMNFEALHMSFSSVVRFFGNFSVLRLEMYEIGKTFTTLKFLHLFYEKIHRFVVHHILGRDVPARAPSLHAEFSDVWDERETSWAWIPTFLTLAIMWWLLKWLYQKVMAVVRPGAAAAAAEADSMAQAFQPTQPPNGPPTFVQQPSYGGGAGPYANTMPSYYDGNALNASSLPPQNYTYYNNGGM